MFWRDFVEYHSTVLVRSQAFWRVLYTLFAKVLLMIVINHLFFAFWESLSSIHRYHQELQTSRLTHVDLLDRYYPDILDVWFSAVSCSGRLGFCRSEEASCEYCFHFVYMDLLFHYLPEQGHHI